MKNTLQSLCISLGILISTTAIAKSGAVILRDAEAAKRFPGTEIVRLKDFSSIPNYVRFSANQQIGLNEVKQWIENHCALETPLTYIPVSSSDDDLGFSHYKFQQTHQGIPLENMYLMVHVKNNMVHSFNGDLFSKIHAATTQQTLTESEALTLAKKAMGAQIYKWELAEEERFIKWEQNDPAATFFPKGHVTLFNKTVTLSKSSEFRLAYKFDMYAHKPVRRADVYIDALTGEVLFEEEKILHIDAVGTAQTAYSSTQTITADQTGGSYRLRESGRGNGIETYNMQQGTSYGSAVDFTDSDNNWNNANPQLDEYATDAHWGSEMTYDYYMQKHNQNSIDNNGFRLRNYIHYDVDYINAFWDGQRMTYGDGDASQGYYPLTSIDIAGHEVTHGLVSNTADLIYNAESGALNESFADIFGVSIDFFARPSQANYLMGEEISTGNPFRSMSNPNQYGDPDTYQGTNWVFGPQDHYGVHSNSGVQNFWYYLMVNGGTGTNDNGDAYTVAGIGMDNAAKIAFRNLTVYLGPNSQYADARFYAEQSAVDLFGACSPELTATENAWYAVGVGGLPSGGGANFSAAQTNGCTLPFTANFTTASGSSSYAWDFGDGGTSTTQNPTHTYTQLGTFTVTLEVSGGSCGSDTVTKISYIVVDTVGGCPVILPAGGTAPTQTACTGVFYDDGGPNGDYTEDAGYSYITIAPTGATSIDFDFLSFNIEASVGCIWDYLRIYDGPSSSSPLLGEWCGSNGPTGIVSSSTGIVLVEFYSDPLDVGPGFAIEWTCQTGGTTGIPNADFSTSSAQICTGSSVNFTNLSTSATSYSWNMPGATPSTSTALNPSVIYSTPGTYSVTLTATNGANSDVEVRNNIITVVQGAQANFNALPGGLSVTLNDQSVGATSWSWTFGDGQSSTAQNPSHTYASGGTYQVCLTADNNNCPASNYCTSVTVNASSTGVPQAAISISSSSICMGDTVNFYDQSTNNPSSYQWTFPGGTPATSTLQNPVVIYNTPGIYSVTLVATNSLGSNTSTYPSYVVVNSNPTANFIEISNALTVNFIDQSTGASNFLWNFGDGQASNQSSPMHSYAAPGTYYVCLTASNLACAPAIYCDSISVFPTAIESLDKTYLTQIYPNPSTDVLNIKITSNKSQNYILKLTDALGRIVQTRVIENTSSLHEIMDINTYPAGTYVLFVNENAYKVILE